MSEADLPEQLTLRPGEERRIMLPSHGGGGYRWQAGVDGDSVEVSVDFEDTFPREDLPAPVRSVSQVLAIVAVRPGVAAVVLQEGRSWESLVTTTHRIEVQVR
ncbi:protease inhibitor I42 family protein [Pengzhenrongella phosphoraccumulans]|uniref:protease inhibitor I42 family protein n=1 Tax=Pengzhenrongella phosphoraccumulans TaxID=3114394 RepID=UPI0038903120